MLLPASKRQDARCAGSEVVKACPVSVSRLCQSKPNLMELGQFGDEAVGTGVDGCARDPGRVAIAVPGF